MHNFFFLKPTLNTERLCLRTINEGDAEDIFAFTSLEQTTEFLSWYPHKTIDTTRQFINSVIEKAGEGLPNQWVIELKAEKKVIGIAGFIDFSEEHKKAEIAFVLSPHYAGKGYMTEALLKILDFGFTQCRLKRIQAKAEPENTASVNVLQRIGMQKEGILRSFIFRKNAFRDYVMLASINQNEV
ncbi:MAG: GNAT family N-acetyltransferase [Bacteroidetes bacterium]|nr:GNAT family N-acetyltransferase [Bacteroidota bacterium]